eukprot:g1909.t1
MLFSGKVNKRVVRGGNRRRKHGSTKGSSNSTKQRNNGTSSTSLLEDARRNARERQKSRKRKKSALNIQNLYRTRKTSAKIRETLIDHWAQNLDLMISKHVHGNDRTNGEVYLREYFRFAFVFTRSFPSPQEKQKKKTPQTASHLTLFLKYFNVAIDIFSQLERSNLISSVHGDNGTGNSKSNLGRLIAYLFYLLTWVHRHDSDRDISSDMNTSIHEGNKGNSQSILHSISLGVKVMLSLESSVMNDQGKHPIPIWKTFGLFTNHRITLNEGVNSFSTSKLQGGNSIPVVKLFVKLLPSLVNTFASRTSLQTLSMTQQFCLLGNILCLQKQQSLLSHPGGLTSSHRVAILTLLSRLLKFRFVPSCILKASVMAGRNQQDTSGTVSLCQTNIRTDNDMQIEKMKFVPGENTKEKTILAQSNNTSDLSQKLTEDGTVSEDVAMSEDNSEWSDATHISTPKIKNLLFNRQIRDVYSRQLADVKVESPQSSVLSSTEPLSAAMGEVLSYLVSLDFIANFGAPTAAVNIEFVRILLNIFDTFGVHLPLESLLALCGTTQVKRVIEGRISTSKSRIQERHAILSSLRVYFESGHRMRRYLGKRLPFLAQLVHLLDEVEDHPKQALDVIRLLSYFDVEALSEAVKCQTQAHSQQSMLSGTTKPYFQKYARLLNTHLRKCLFQRYSPEYRTTKLPSIVWILVKGYNALYEQYPSCISDWTFPITKIPSGIFTHLKKLCALVDGKTRKKHNQHNSPSGGALSNHLDIQIATTASRIPATADTGAYSDENKMESHESEDLDGEWSSSEDDDTENENTYTDDVDSDDPSNSSDQNSLFFTGTPQLLFPLSGRTGLAFIIANLPQCLAFNHRVKLFASRLELSKRQHANASSMGLFHGSGRKNLSVRRQHIYMDSFHALAKAPIGVLKRAYGLRIQFINETGQIEPGIDGGGLSREYLQELCKALFSSKLFFSQTTEHGLLYPNSQPEIQFPFSVQMDHWRFIGRIMGKALYDGVLVEQMFAPFFLNRLLGRQVYIRELRYLDNQLYKSLLYLKTHKMSLNFEDLQIYFENETEEEARDNMAMKEARLVTRQNVDEYIAKVASYRLSRQFSSQTNAFLQGFNEFLPHNEFYLFMFNSLELQELMGGSQADFDVAKLRNVTNYTGYHPSQPYVKAFWNLVENEFTSEQRRKFLFFVTGCSREPLQGFGSLEPGFCIQEIRPHDTNSSSTSNSQNSKAAPMRLPSAATCMNLLRLPRYPSITILKEKLIYSIENAQGFQLS